MPPNDRETPLSRRRACAMLATLLAPSAARAAAPAAAAPAVAASAAASAPSPEASTPSASAPGTAALPAADPRAALAATLARQTGLPVEGIAAALARVRIDPRVQRLILPGRPEQKNWHAYRDRFVDDVRIAAGARFVRANADAFASAEAAYGVPRRIIAGILGVETIYGRRMGTFPVLDALGTLALAWPTAAGPGGVARDRSAYFAAQLGDFLLWCERTGADPAAPLGSYAGAIGMPQFMPGSILRYAVAATPGRPPDLAGNPADAIVSIGNFLRAHGWTRGRPARFPLLVPPTLPPATLARLLAPDVVPTFSAAELRDAGLSLLPEVLDDPDPLAVVQLPNVGAPPDYVLGSGNFYTITRYNHSAFYALAVIELGEAIEDALAG